MGSDRDTGPETLESELCGHAGEGSPIGRWWKSEVEIRVGCSNRGRGRIGE